MKRIKLTNKNAKWFVFVYKFSVIAGFISLSLLFIVPLLIGCLQLMPEDRAYSLFCFMLIPFFLFGFIVLLFPFVVEDPDGITAIITKAEKYKTNVSSYEQFLSMAQESLGGDGFARVQEQAFAEYQMTLYGKKSKFANVNCVLLIKASEITNEIIDDSNEVYVRWLEESYGKKNHVSLIAIVCVNRINSAFRKVVDTEPEQDFDKSRFIAGLSFGGKSVYISQQKSGFAILKYKKLKRVFFRLFGFLTTT